jgi:hypothetical protein
MKTVLRNVKFFLCVNNDACEDLILHKIYRMIPDKKAEKEGFIRVIDESGEDYLYPLSNFTDVNLSQKARSTLLAVH